MDRATLRTRAQALAQDAVLNSGSSQLPMVIRNSADYDVCLDVALAIFSQARPNRRVVDAVAGVAGFRQVLYGAGAMAQLAGADAWVPDEVGLESIIHPYLATVQGRDPDDPNVYRVLPGPNDTVVLEWIDRSVAATDVLRLTFTRPHILDEAPSMVTAPATGPTAALASPAAPGVVDDGTHSYDYTFVTANGETDPSPGSNVVTVAAQGTNGQVQLTGIAVSSQAGVTARNIYRRIAGDTGSRKRVGTIANNTGTTFTDNLADSSLGAAAPTVNTAGGTQTVRETDREALATLTASILLQMAANKMAQNTGSSNLPNDIVDRRTPADILRSAAKDLRTLYATLVGTGSDVDTPAASGFIDLDVESTYGQGFLTRSARQH